ncbi:MAG: VWA domain-containing protein [Acidobacteriota bacterium]|nr:VWA domain-containing protein [Acidobacteriota bacterium]
MKSRGFWSTALAGGAMTALLAAQAAPPPKPLPVNPGAGEVAPNFSVAVNLVTTDVIVRNAKGEFVPDLTKKDFTVLEDGIKQDISSLVLVHGGRTYNLVAPAPPPQQEGIILPQTRPAADVAGRIFILFVDDLHLDFQNTGRIRELFKKIEKDLIHPGDEFAIVSTGPSSIAVQLTYDRQELDDAIKKITGDGLKPDDIINGPESDQGPDEVRYRASVAFSTAYDLLKSISKIQNRRKAIIYVSDGYDFNPFEGSRHGSSNTFDSRFDAATYDPSTDGQAFQGQVFADSDLARELGALTRAANRANATFYTIDPRGLPGFADLEQNVDPTEWADYIRKSQDSLRVLADLTGGIAVVNQNDFDKALKRIDAETSDYYVLGYYSKNPDPRKKVRSIDVKVDRPGVEVWSRKTYYLPSPPVPVSAAKGPGR